MAKRLEPNRCDIVRPSLLFDHVVISLWPDFSCPNGSDPILKRHQSGVISRWRSHEGNAT